MFVRFKKSARTLNPIVQIVESVRVEGKVQQKVIASLGSASSQEAFEQLEKLAHNLLEKLEIEKRRQPSLFPDFEIPAGEMATKQPDTVKLSSIDHKATVYDGYPTVVAKLFEMAGFSAIVKKAQGRKQYDVEKTLNLIIAQRFFTPASKLRTFQRQNSLGFSEIKLQHIYRSMDALWKHDEGFQRQAFASAHGGLFQDPVECFFFDVTTLWFESTNQDELREFGFSKDQKSHSVQMMLCLVVNREGIPLAYESFKGNTAEVTTLIPVMEKIRRRFEVEKVTVVCDRGLASLDNILNLGKKGFQYVVACKLKHLSKELRLNDLSTFKELHKLDDDTVMTKVIDHPTYPDTLLIVTHSTKRALKDKYDRERLVDKINTKIKGSVNKGHPAKKLISNNGYKKFVKVTGQGATILNEEAIEASKAWDGFHGIAVSKSQNLTVEEALSQYRGLWRVEETFRIAKCTLKTRPIFHWAPDSIRAHILICFLTLYLERQLELLLRRANTPLTPDRIRFAISQMHHIQFTDRARNRTGKMESSLSGDAKAICSVLNLPLRRRTYFES